jgi:hypothetical protein
MTDEELLRVVTYQKSLVPVARAVLADELRRRGKENPILSAQLPSAGLEPYGGSAGNGFDHKTMTFSSSIGAAAGALLASLGWGLLIVTAARAYARQYSWLAQSLQLSDGTTARFTGDPKKIWFLAMTVGLLPQVHRWLTPVISRQLGDEAARTIVLLIFMLVLCSAQTVVYLEICTWAVSGISLSSGTVLHFDGGAMPCFGFVCVGNLLGALLLPTRGLILLALPPLSVWSLRWGLSHVHSERRRLRFVGSLAQTSWRSFAAMAFSIPLLTIPAVVVWINKWGAANILVESRDRRGTE